MGAGALSGSVASGHPQVTLRSAPAGPFDGAIAAARTLLFASRDRHRRDNVRQRENIGG